jgi:hypothetical protein
MDGGLIFISNNENSVQYAAIGVTYTQLGPEMHSPRSQQKDLECQDQHKAIQRTSYLLTRDICKFIAML